MAADIKLDIEEHARRLALEFGTSLSSAAILALETADTEVGAWLPEPYSTLTCSPEVARELLRWFEAQASGG